MSHLRLITFSARKILKFVPLEGLFFCPGRGFNSGGTGGGGSTPGRGANSGWLAGREVQLPGGVNNRGGMYPHPEGAHVSKGGWRRQVDTLRLFHFAKCRAWAIELDMENFQECHCDGSDEILNK